MKLSSLSAESFQLYCPASSTCCDEQLLPSDEKIYKRIEILLELPETNATSSGRGGDVLDPGGGRGDPGDGDNGGFGFVLRGGVHRDPARCRPLTVSRVIPGSQADKLVSMFVELLR